MKTLISNKNSEVLLREYCHELGFDVMAITSPDLPPEISSGLQEFLNSEHHGDMLWMKEKSALRSNPRSLWPDVKSVIVVGHNYAPAENPLKKLTQKNIGNISCYALNADYHDVIKKKLKILAGKITKELGCELKLFVDTAPVMEKPLAVAAGIGWQGKHTCLVSREFGNWLFLGIIFLSCDLTQTEGENNHNNKIAADKITAQNFGHCGSCTKCLDICPTAAFTSAGKLDARKCISYLTIEHKGQIPLEYRAAIGNRIYGCDDCLAICPWNKFAKKAQEISYNPRPEFIAPPLAELALLDDKNFRKLFAKSPVKRIGRERFIRNVLVAIGNSKDISLLNSAKNLRKDPSPLIAEMANWAIRELCDAS